MPATLSPDRTLGLTGVPVPVLGYGTAPLGKSEVPRAHGVRCLNHAIDRGITYLDTSPDYNSEPVVGEVMKSRRDEVFLATKVNRRSKEGALSSLKESLDRLQTDHVDLVQVHAVNAWADLEQALAPDGAVAGLTEACDEGLTRFIGITGHAHPDILREGLNRHRFDTLLVACGMPDHLVTAPDVTVLPTAAQRRTGVIAMKVFGHGTIKRRDLALRYSLNLPGVCMAILGLETESQIDEAILLAQDISPLTAEEERTLVEEARILVEQDADASWKETGDLFWLHDTTVMGWSTDDAPSLVRY